MRIVLTIILLFGILLVGGATFLAIDAYATEDRREAFQQAVAERGEAHSEKTRRERRIDPIGRVARVYTDLKQGVFKSSKLDLPELLPPAPEDWTRRDYADEDGTAITGAVLERTPLATTTTNSVLKDFAKAGQGSKMNARATYQNGERLIALRLVGDLTTIRRAEKGEINARAAKGQIFARIDGVPVVQEPRFSMDFLQDKRVPVTYRRFTIALDGQVEVELLTNAADADVLGVLSGLDMTRLQDGLPLKTLGFVANAGTIGPEDPATEPPA